MDSQEFLEFARQAASYREKQVERIEVRSRQEISALREWTDKIDRSDSPSNLAVPYFGIPIVLDESVPPGVLRCIRDGEVVAEVTVR